MNATAHKTLYTLASCVVLASFIGGAPARAGALEDQLAMTDGLSSHSGATFDGPQGRPAYLGAAHQNPWLDAQLAISDGNLQSVQAVSDGPEGPRADRAPSSNDSFIERQRTISDGNAF